MDKESPQLIIKAMRLLSSMQLMLTYITNLDLKHHKWVEEAKCPETNPVTAAAAVEEEDKADLKHVADILLAVLISVGPAVLLNSSITVKFAKSHVQVSDTTMWFNLRTVTSKFTFRLLFSQGPQTYKDHLDGQKHKKKEAAVRTGLPMVCIQLLMFLIQNVDKWINRYLILLGSNPTDWGRSALRTLQRDLHFV